MTNSNVLITSIQNASLAFGDRLVFDGLDFELKSGQFTALLGRSGVGKSALLRMMAGILKSSKHVNAKITYPAENISQNIAYMGQTDLLLPWLSALDNTLLGLKLRKPTQHKTSYIEKAKSLLTLVGLVDSIHALPHQLSGGMRQRVALVRTLMEDKPIVLMDEPFSALDAVTRYQLQNVSLELLHDRTVLFVTHDPNEALRIANTIYIMLDQPAHIHLFAHLPSPAPREFSNEQLHHLQAQLFEMLSQKTQTQP